jgi:hypothetical protein
MSWLLAIAELALGCCFFAIGIEAIAQRNEGRPSPFRLREFHHGYAGALLVLVGLQLHGPIGIALELVGLVLTLDDLYQHARQTLFGDIEYVSPLHILFAFTLWRIPAVQAATRFLDRWWLTLAVFGLLAVWLTT